MAFMKSLLLYRYRNVGESIPELLLKTVDLFLKQDKTLVIFKNKISLDNQETI